MNIPSQADPATRRPAGSDPTGVARTFRAVRLLLAGYLAIGVATLVAVVLLRNDTAAVNPAVWVRTVIVVVTAALLSLFAARAARGSRGAYRRLRIIAIVTPVAIAAIIVVPGTFPLWLKLEQGVCGLLMVAVAVLANGRRLRAAFTTDGR
ncbi:hypothetical protein [Actinocatenispora rupis]|uniref:Uncharacterized protein n=1 Tax=Actinocatenispora rupis TaxID=519421 RepID=A0A8J3NDW1_9ACTN|nr:hypothetical protein [Actinocatenispora rupis]GID15709.1 hypothetical protein Aru02nite_65980 [Actinocatenispora rupis]